MGSLQVGAGYPDRDIFVFKYGHFYAHGTQLWAAGGPRLVRLSPPRIPTVAPRPARGAAAGDQHWKAHRVGGARAALQTQEPQEREHGAWTLIPPLKVRSQGHGAGVGRWTEVVRAEDGRAPPPAGSGRQEGPREPTVEGAAAHTQQAAWVSSLCPASQHLLVFRENAGRKPKVIQAESPRCSRSASSLLGAGPEPGH